MNNRNVNEHFSTSAEKQVQNRISPYQLNNEEKAQIWSLVGYRDQLTKSQKDYFADNKERLISDEYDKIKGRQQPLQNHNLGKSQPNNAILRGRAETNVLNNQYNALKEIQRNTDSQINQVLDNARRDGRGPSHLQNEFTRAHDHDRR